MNQRPTNDEHDSYYSLYVDQVPEGDLLEMMESELEQTLALLANVPAELEEHRYEPGKWSVREAVGHMVDVEKLFGFRALWFARLDPAQLPPMDQDQWAANSNAATRPLAALSEEFAFARRANRAMFASFDNEMLSRRGIASGMEFTVKSLAFILLGHEIHHRRVLTECYLQR